MPRIPTRPGPQVLTTPDPTPFQQINPPAAAFGTAGAGVAGIGGSLTQIAQAQIKQNEEDARTRAKELDIEFRRQIRLIEYGDGTEANPGYYSLRGRNAVDATQSTQEAIAKVRQDMMSNVEDTDVLELFSVASGTREQAALEGIFSQSLAENEKAKDAASAARIVEMGQDAALAYNNDKFIAEQEGLLKAEIFETARRQGWDKDILDNQLGDTLSKFHAGIIINAMTQDVSRAQELFDRWGSSMDPGIRQDVETKLDNAKELAEIQAHTDAIMLRVDAEGLDREEAMNLARELEGEVRKGVETAIFHRFNEKETVKDERLKEISDGFFGAVNGGLKASDLEQSSPDDWAIFSEDPTLMKQLIAAERAFSERRQFAISTDGSSLQNLREMTEEELITVDPTKVKATLTKEEFEKFSILQDGARAKLEATSKDLRFYRAGRDALRDASRVLGKSFRFGDKKQNENNRKIQNSMEHEMNSFISGEIAAGRVPAAQDILNRASEIVTEFQQTDSPGFTGFISDFVDSVFGSREAFEFEINQMTPQERQNFIVDMEDIPPFVFEDIVDVLEQRGINPRLANGEFNDQLIEQLAGATMLGQRVRAERLLGRTTTSTEFAPAETTVPRVETPTTPETPAEQPGLDEIIQNLTVGGGEAAESPQEPVQREEGVPATSAPIEAAPALSEAPGAEITPEETPLTQAIAQNTLEAQLIEDEGFDTTVYTDSVGVPTIGVGFNLNNPDARSRIEALGHDFDAVVSGDEDLTFEEVRQLFNEDVQKATADARKVLPNFDELSGNRQQAFVNMIFNLGPTGFRGFKKMIAAIKDEDFETAANEAEDSKWFRQVGNRARRIVETIRTG
jgi:GH24 family phage-related lysozyme (muramidase)